MLGTLLAAVTVARARFLRQAADADRSLRATRAANVLKARIKSPGAPAEPTPPGTSELGGVAANLHDPHDHAN